MEPGSIARIVRQPPQIYAPLVGHVCIVVEVDHTAADVTEIKPDGTSTGGGWIPLDCLAPESAPAWLNAKRCHDERIRSLGEQLERRSAAFQARALKVAGKYPGLSAADVIEIHKAMDSEVEVVTTEAAPTPCDDCAGSGTGPFGDCMHCGGSGWKHPFQS